LGAKRKYRQKINEQEAFYHHRQGLFMLNAKFCKW
jgi:hypothetical protein